MTPAQRAAVLHFECPTCDADEGEACRGIMMRVSLLGSQFVAEHDDGGIEALVEIPPEVHIERLARLDSLSAVDRIAAIEKEVDGDW